MTGPIAQPHSHVQPLRQYLRQRTASVHNELDASVGVLDSMDRYARYLKGQFRFRAAMEALLAPESFPAWFDGWRPLPLAGALRADLAALGLAAPPAEDGGPVQHLQRLSGLMGALYVLEGAALGARFLYRSVSELGLSAASGARHLELQTSGQSWQGFLNLLGSPDIDREEAADAAVATFAFARGAFSKGLHEQS
ncbi:MAG: biliverdin-producing heme oxygenase [Sphingomonadales bacterium]